MRSEKPENLVIHFAFDKSEFNPDAKTDIWINEFGVYAEHNSEAALYITGHTDAIGTEDYNQSLGNRRAQSVLLYFEAKGLVAKKIMLESGGEKEPVDELCTTGVSLPGFESALSSNHEQVQLPRICRSYFK